MEEWVGIKDSGGRGRMLGLFEMDIAGVGVLGSRKIERWVERRRRGVLRCVVRSSCVVSRMYFT
jgi:hypothetical protein